MKTWKDEKNNLLSNPAVKKEYDALDSEFTSLDNALHSLSAEEQITLTQEALADVDAGRVIDHHAMEAWASRKATIHSWEEYRRTGEHVTGAEVIAWLETWGETVEQAAPQCHTKGEKRD